MSSFSAEKLSDHLKEYRRSPGAIETPSVEPFSEVNKTQIHFGIQNVNSNSF